MIPYIILISYLLISFAWGLFFTKRPENNPESFFLSNRNLRTVALFFSLIATNFSAFFFLGFAGEAYRVGYAYYPMMAFGTSFAAINFYVIGNKAWRLGKQKAYITPVEMIRGESGSLPLSVLFMLFMILFMLPFLAVQSVGAGLILENITGGAISYAQGVVLMTLLILIYVIVGGMRGIVAMDMKNGIIMLTLMLTAVLVLDNSMGGIAENNLSLREVMPELFDVRGRGDFFTPLKWLSFLLLWSACLPMFPQIFTRFLMGKNLRIFKKTTILYAFIPPFLFIVPVIIGVLGHIDFPGLEGKASDAILPMLLGKYTPDWFSALILTGALAAFISTVDSILMAIASIGTRDFYLQFVKRDANHAGQVKAARWIIFLVAMIGMVIALLRPASIFAIVTMTFSGSALLYPIVIGIFYFRHVHWTWSFWALLSGEIILAALSFQWVSVEWMGTALPVLPAFLWTFIWVLAGEFYGRATKKN